MLLWTDRNHNGISEPDELQPVSGSSLKAISTDYKASKLRDQFGNEFRQRAIATFGNKNCGKNCQETRRFVYDVWLTQVR